MPTNEPTSWAEISGIHPDDAALFDRSGADVRLGVRVAVLPLLATIVVGAFVDLFDSVSMPASAVGFAFSFAYWVLGGALAMTVFWLRAGRLPNYAIPPCKNFVWARYDRIHPDDSALYNRIAVAMWWGYLGFSLPLSVALCVIVFVGVSVGSSFMWLVLLAVFVFANMLSRRLLTRTFFRLLAGRRPLQGLIPTRRDGLDLPDVGEERGPSGWNRGFSIGLRWVVVGVFVVAAVVFAVRTVCQLDRGDFPQTRGPSSYPEERYVELQDLMLELINEERLQAGRDPLTLGDNRAAQIHAESALRNCASSHWGADGLKPHIRYSLAGGYQYNAENISGSTYCPEASEGYLPGPSIERQLREMMRSLKGSPGHLDNLLDRWHRKVNIGLAWDEYSYVFVQHFEGDYVEYERMPSIEEGVLSLSGTVRGGMTFEADEDLSIAVTYDPPPRPLSRGQLSRTYCYDLGLPVASLRPPLTGDLYYLWDEYSQSYPLISCPNPYDIPPNASAPRSREEAGQQSKEARISSVEVEDQSITVPWITALEWTVAGQDFAVTADLGDVVAEHGSGVYTVVVWGRQGSEDVQISLYSIFHEVDPPDTYDPEGR